MRQQVRKEIGVEFNLKSEQLIAHYDMPFTLNIEELSDRIELAKSFFYMRDQASTATLIEHLVKDKLIYSRGEKEYYFFNGSRWELKSSALKLIYNILIIVADECFVRFGEQDGNDGIQTLHDVLNIIGSVSWRQKIDTLLKESDVISKKEFPWDSPDIMETLTFENGVIDFSSGELISRKGKPEEYRRSYIDLPVKEVMEAGDPKNFKEFLRGIFPNKDTRKTAVQALSTSVSGTGKYRKIQIWNGHGNNGKSKLITLMEAIIGDRAITYDSDILLQRTRGVEDPSAVTPGVARFQGTLLAMGSETEEGKKISQGIVKNMTGNEKITANPKYKGEISFYTTFQMVLATNYLPVFSAYDDAFINRLLVVPFNASFYTDEAMKLKFEKQKRPYILPAKDPNEIQKNVLEERAAVLKFLIETYVSFNDIFVADECKHMLKAYISENNDLGKFLDTYMVLEEEGFVSVKHLVEFYNLEHNTHVSVQWMGRRLRQLHPELRDGRKRIDGTMQRGFYGMTLDREGIEEEEMF
jgi:P4 family phage/plasmid primase-like protien